MNKESISINLTPAALSILDSKLQSLDLTRSVYLESLLVRNLYEQSYLPSSDELNSLNNGFLMNSLSSITWDFRKNISKLSQPAIFATVSFFYGLNLVGDIAVSSQKQCNIKKGNNLICYFAVGDISRWSVYDRVYSLKNTPFILGPAAQSNDEYIFISDLQQFTVPGPYVHFVDLCHLLNVPVGTKVIQIHFSQLDNLLAAIENI